MTLNINVTQEKINLGSPRRGCACPITLSIIEELDRLKIDYRNVNTAQTYVKILFDRVKYQLIELPWQAIKFIRLFDDNQPVEPFSFTVEMK